jgi:hypothetical protein
VIRIRVEAGKEWEENFMELPEYVTVDEVKRVCEKLTRAWDEI